MDEFEDLSIDPYILVQHIQPRFPEKADCSLVEACVQNLRHCDLLRSVHEAAPGSCMRFCLC